MSRRVTIVLCVIVGLVGVALIALYVTGNLGNAAIP